MDSSNVQFWMMISSIVTAICFVVMAIALVGVLLVVRKVVGTVQRLEDRIAPFISKVDAIGAQGREISVSFAEVSSNLSTATKHLAESTELIRDEVAELKAVVSNTALVAREKVEMVSDTIDQTHTRVTDTADFVNEKIVVPAREIAAIMAGVRRGLEVLFAPAPKQIDRVYVDDELFIG